MQADVRDKDSLELQRPAEAELTQAAQHARHLCMVSEIRHIHAHEVSVATVILVPALLECPSSPRCVPAAIVSQSATRLHTRKFEVSTCRASENIPENKSLAALRLIFIADDHELGEIPGSCGRCVTFED